MLSLAQYTSRADRSSYQARSRLDSGIAEVEGGYSDITLAATTVSTPSTGTASKSSTR